MNYQEERFVRFQDWNSVQSPSSEKLFDERRRSKFTSILSFIWSTISKRIDILKNTFVYQDEENSTTKKTNSRKKILDPQGPFLQRWNKVFVLSCVMAVSVDPLFFYIPVVDHDSQCINMDARLEITASVLRSFTDIFYIIHIIFQFRTGFIAPSSRVFGRGVLVEDLGAIAWRYLSTYFLIDILAVLPLPQVVVLIIIPKLKGSSHHVDAKSLLMSIVILQYVPRLVRIIPLYLEVTRSAGIITETAWAGAAFNLLLYMLASHVLGAYWYFLSIEREYACWRDVCSNGNCSKESFYCTKDAKMDMTVDVGCPIKQENSTIYNFGIFLPALQNVAESTNFWEKLFYCLWWGLQNLSSLGQNLETSTYVWEILFAVFIAIAGLVLFSLLIGNMQTYLQSTTVRIEEMRVKRRDAEQWMSHRLLPDEIKSRIRRYEQYRWQETRGVDEESLLQNLPKDIRRDIKRHLCLALLMRVPMFELMDDQLMDAMCDRLKPVLYTEESCIIREGDPVDEMLFIMRGKLQSVTTNGGRTGFFNSEILKAGDFCGEELLTWALDPRNSSSLPSSTRTVKTLTEVEAFALMADDLKFVAAQFRRLHSKQLRHAFRFYSQQWRTWAACFIQAAWRRYSRKKLEESLREDENRLQEALVKENGNAPSFGAAIYASRFAAKALRLLRKDGVRKARLQDRFPCMLLQKPSEPDFTVEEGYSVLQVF